VSGGADSTALLRGLANLAREFGLTLHAAHLHHGLRGAAADADLAFVRALCARVGVPLVAARMDGRARLRARGLSGQDGLRVLRREFLARAARRAGATHIATAHTADDQLETMLLRLGRGAGLPGLGGISPRRGRLIRPLLEATRAAVAADLTRIGQVWREDASNLDLRYARNRVRHEVVPALLAAIAGGAAAPSARAGLARRAAATTREARAAQRALAAWTSPVLSRASRIQRTDIALDSNEVASYPFAAQRTMLRRLWRGLGGPREGLTHRHLDALCRLLVRPRNGARVRLPSGWVAEREADQVHFRRDRVRRELRESR